MDRSTGSLTAVGLKLGWCTWDFLGVCAFEALTHSDDRPVFESQCSWPLVLLIYRMVLKTQENYSVLIAPLSPETLM